METLFFKKDGLKSAIKGIERDIEYANNKLIEPIQKNIEFWQDFRYRGIQMLNWFKSETVHKQPNN